jgi:hypothetical protein
VESRRATAENPSSLCLSRSDYAQDLQGQPFARLALFCSYIISVARW